MDSDVLTDVLSTVARACEDADLDADSHEARELLDDAIHHADAVWVAEALLPVPVIGKAIWLLRRKAVS